MTTEGERIPTGTLIDGRYEIRGFLGEGGMGTVYRAVDTKMGQPVAIKMLLQRGSSERTREERRRRFMTEIFAINEVAHRNIVQVLEFGFFKDTPFMVMELLNGRDLGQIINATREPLGIDYCVDMMLVVCAAIQACHDEGIIHRDLKPGNVMLIETDSGHGWDVKVLDFSISSIGKVAGDLTREGQILGTPRFLSPEQVCGKVLPASDQYAIGLLLYVCLTKRHPLGKLDGLPLIRAIERGDIPRPRSLRPDIPEGLERVIMKATHVDPAERFPTVHHLGREIRLFGSDLGQSLWKKYYDTPAVPRARDDSNRVSDAIPLVLQMVQGKVPSNGSSTALAHYQSTTAVRGATTTDDDPEARAAAREDPGAPAATVPLTSTGQTLDDPEAQSLPVMSSTSWRARELAAGERQPKRRRSYVVIVSGLATLIVGGTLLLTVRGGRQARGAPEAAIRSEPAVRPTAPVTAPPAAATPMVAPAIDRRAEMTMEAKPAEATNPRDQQSKRAEHAHPRRKESKNAGWGVDPFGNPIPPP